MPSRIFKGIITALITPFKDNKIDFYSFEKIIERQILAGVNAIIPAGTTGESPTLSTEEHSELIAFVVKVANGRVPVIAGTGSNDTAASVHMSLVSEKCGAEGVMCVAPYYNKPTQEGLFRHYKEIHDAISLPVMLYSVPHRVVIDFSDDLIIRICDSLPRVLALKDASGDMGRPLRLKNALKNRLNLLTGNDNEAVSFNAAGGIGCVSVASNIVPELCKKVQDLCASGDFISARNLQQSLFPLYRAIFTETNPICVKYAASLLGLCEADLRLPLSESSSASKKMVEEAISFFLN